MVSGKVGSTLKWSQTCSFYWSARLDHKRNITRFPSTLEAVVSVAHFYVVIISIIYSVYFLSFLGCDVGWDWKRLKANAFIFLAYCHFYLCKVSSLCWIPVRHVIDSGSFNESVAHCLYGTSMVLCPIRAFTYLSRMNFSTSVLTLALLAFLYHAVVWMIFAFRPHFNLYGHTFGSAISKPF